MAVTHTLIYCELKSYKNTQERLYYEGLEQKRQKEKVFDDKWKAQHPFQPNLGLRKRPSSIIQNSNNSEYDKKSEKDMHVQRYIKNNYDEKTGQPLFKPVVNPYNPEVIKKAYQVRYKQELNDQAREVDKKIAAVFRFFTLGSDVLRIQDLDCINLKNECIVLLKNVIVNIIKSNNHLTYSDFVDLVLSENLMPDINRTYDFIEGRKVSGETRKISRRTDSLSAYDSNYDQMIHKVVSDQNVNSVNHNAETLNSKKIKLTKNYSKLV